MKMDPIDVEVRVNIDSIHVGTHRVEVPVPTGSRILLFQLSHALTQSQVQHFADAVRARTLDHWRNHPDEPAILVVTDDVTVRWLEAEAPEKAPRAPSTLPKQQRPMTKVTKGLGPAPVRTEAT